MYHVSNISRRCGVPTRLYLIDQPQVYPGLAMLNMLHAILPAVFHKLLLSLVYTVVCGGKLSQMLLTCRDIASLKITKIVQNVPRWLKCRRSPSSVPNSRRSGCVSGWSLGQLARWQHDGGRGTWVVHGAPLAMSPFSQDHYQNPSAAHCCTEH